MSIKRPVNFERERTVVTYDHAALTATTTAKIWKVPADRKFYVERVSYINPTGLTEDAANNFKGTVNNGSDVIASLFNTDSDLAPDVGASLAVDTWVEGDLSPYLAVADTVFTAAAATDILTASTHGLLTGDGPVRVANGGGALPGGLAASTDYWVIKIDADTFYLATSLANALAGTRINITSDGTGTQTLSDTASTLRNSGIPAFQWLDAGEDLSVVFTETGTATLPAGRLVIEGYLY